jgi:Zn-dependent peptidase ImmA (M78 family)
MLPTCSSGIRKRSRHGRTAGLRRPIRNWKSWRIKYTSAHWRSFFCPRRRKNPFRSGSSAPCLTRICKPSRAHAYQIGLQELFDGHNPAERPIWKAITLSQSQEVALQAAAIRDYLGILLDQQTAWKSDERALKAWRKTIEGCGVFIFKAAFKQKDISGFCLMDEHLPVNYLNNSTTKTRQIFSLLHELAHLLLSMNGLSKFDTSYIERLPKREKEIERFCNAIAAEVLIPGTDFATRRSSFQLMWKTQTKRTSRTLPIDMASSSTSIHASSKASGTAWTSLSHGMI